MSNESNETPLLIVFLTNLRKKENWSAEQIGAMLDLSKGMVYAYEKGRAQLGARSLGRLRKRFKGTPSLPRITELINAYLDWLAEQPSLGARGPRPDVDRATGWRKLGRPTRKKLPTQPPAE